MNKKTTENHKAKRNTKQCFQDSACKPIRAGQTLVIKSDRGRRGTSTMMFKNETFAEELQHRI